MTHFSSSFCRLSGFLHQLGYSSLDSFLPQDTMHSVRFGMVSHLSTVLCTYIRSSLLALGGLACKLQGRREAGVVEGGSDCRHRCRPHCWVGWVCCRCFLVSTARTSLTGGSSCSLTHSSGSSMPVGSNAKQWSKKAAKQVRARSTWNKSRAASKGQL